MADTTAHARLREFLRLSQTNGDCMERALQAAAPILGCVQRGEYPLASPEDLEQSNPLDPTKTPWRDLISRAVVRVTGQPIERVVAVSRREPVPVPRPAWAAQRAWERAFITDLIATHSDVLDESIGPSCELEIDRAHDEALEAAFPAVAREHRFDLRWGTSDIDGLRATGVLPKGMTWARTYTQQLRGVLGEEFNLKLNDLIDPGCSTVLVALRYLCGYAIVGQRDKVEDFERLLACCTVAIPLGWKADEPGTLLVRVQ